ncbi:diguanylate cyclase [Pseudomonas sp. SWI36]|nr:diguanylate cyclase [Pseudomonas sp. SWI36]
MNADPGVYTPPPVGVDMPANTGEAGAMYRVARFAGMPAPTSPP